MVAASKYGEDSGDHDVKVDLEGDEIEVAEKIKVILNGYVKYVQ